jgi:hypothetical protein
MKNGRDADAILRKEAPGRLRPPVASFVRSRDVVIRLELQPLPEAVTGNADQDKAGNDEDDMQHAGSDAGNRDKVQLAGGSADQQDCVTSAAQNLLNSYAKQLNQHGV